MLQVDFQQNLLDQSTKFEPEKVILSGFYYGMEKLNILNSDQHINIRIIKSKNSYGLANIRWNQAQITLNINKYNILKNNILNSAQLRAIGIHEACHPKSLENSIVKFDGEGQINSYNNQIRLKSLRIFKEYICDKLNFKIFGLNEDYISYLETLWNGFKNIIGLLKRYYSEKLVMGIIQDFSYYFSSENQNIIRDMLQEENLGNVYFLMKQIYEDMEFIFQLPINLEKKYLILQKYGYIFLNIHFENYLNNDENFQNTQEKKLLHEKFNNFLAKICRISKDWHTIQLI